MLSYIDQYTVDKRFYYPHKRERYADSKKLWIVINVPLKFKICGLDTHLYTARPIVAKIDTGSTYVALTKKEGEKVAKDLNLNLRLDSENKVVYLYQANGSVIVGCKHMLDLQVCSLQLKKTEVVFPPSHNDQEYWYTVLKYSSLRIQNSPRLSYYELNNNLFGVERLLDRMLISLDAEASYIFKRKP